MATLQSDATASATQPLRMETPMKTIIIAAFATLALATNVFAASMPYPVCTGSSSTLTPHGSWDCR